MLCLIGGQVGRFVLAMVKPASDGLSQVFSHCPVRHRRLHAGTEQACKPYGRLNVLIGDDDPLGSFVFRTTGFNSIRTLSARLVQAISGNRLARTCLWNCV